MAKSSKPYLGLSYIVSLILAIIPVTAWILGIFQCIQEGRILAAIVRIFFGAWIVWLLDLIWMIIKKDLCHIWIIT